MNRIKSLSFIVCLFFLNHNGFSQSQYLSPMPDYPMLLSANFAEARPAHLHGGIDIKTNQEEGHRVVAVKDGYISRIGVQPYGYGNVLYMTHYDGTTTVYGHLKKFVPVLDAYLTAMRYQTETNEVDLFPEKDQFKFKAGELIAFSGNTGGSMGPHLHFEVRNTETQTPLNILHNKIYTPFDTIRPLIKALHFIAVDTINGVPMERKVKTFNPIYLSKGEYGFKEPIPIPSNGYFAIEVTDRKNNTQNTFGVYSIKEFFNDEITYELAIDSFKFSETRYVNSLTVYDMQRNSRNEVFRLTQNENCHFSGLKTYDDKGVLKIDSLVKNVDIEIEDDLGNTSNLSFVVSKDPNNTSGPQFTRHENGFFLDYRMETSISYSGLSIMIEKGTLFENTYLILDKKDSLNVKLARTTVSPIYQISSNNFTTFKPFTLNFDLSEIDENFGYFPKNIVIATVDPITGKMRSAGGKIENRSIKLNTYNGGYFCLVQDTIPPTIRLLIPRNFAWASSKSVSFKLSDDFSGVKSYALQIDDEFAILEFNSVKSIVTHNFDDTRFGKGVKHTMVLTVTDGAGNIKQYSKTYTR